MDKPTFVDALTGSKRFEAPDLIFPESYHTCFTNQDNSLPFIKNATRRNGKPALLLSAEEQISLANPLKHTLICKFSARMPSFELIRKHFESLKLRGPWRIGILDFRHVMIKLELELDYTFLFTKKLHRIENGFVKFLKWTADFDFRSEPPIAPVWIKFPSLKLHLFHKQVLFSLATIFGKPLKLDLPTFNLARPSVARVLVEMDITFTYADDIWIGSQDEGYWQEVVIDSKPLYCSKCRIFGHYLDNCFIANPHLRQVITSRDNEYVPTADKGLNSQTPVDKNGLEMLLASSGHLSNLPIQNRAYVNENQPSFELGNIGKLSNQEDMTSVLQETDLISNSCQLDHTGGGFHVQQKLPITCMEKTVTGLVVREPNTVVLVFPSLTIPAAALILDIPAELGDPVLANSATFDHHQHMGNQAMGFKSLPEVPAVVFPAVLGIQIGTVASDMEIWGSGSVAAISTTGLLSSIPDTTAALDVMPPALVASDFPTAVIFSAVMGNEFGIAHPTAAASDLVMHAPVYSNPHHNAKDFNSEQGNTDSDSYETFTGSYTKEDMQLNDACREVFEE